MDWLTDFIWLFLRNFLKCSVETWDSPWWRSGHITGSSSTVMIWSRGYTSPHSTLDLTAIQHQGLEVFAGNNGIISQRWRLKDVFTCYSQHKYLTLGFLVNVFSWKPKNVGKTVLSNFSNIIKLRLNSNFSAVLLCINGKSFSRGTLSAFKQWVVPKGFLIKAPHFS